MRLATTAIFALSLMLVEPVTAQVSVTHPSDVLREEHSIRPPVLSGGGNAAYEYFKVWDSLNQEDRYAMDNAYMSQTEIPGHHVDAAMHKLFEAHQDYIDGLKRAASMPVCDWGVQHQFGLDFRLPQLQLLRRSYRVLHVEALRQMDDHRPGPAAAAIAALVRLSLQTTSDNTLISSLVGRTHNQGAIELTQTMIREETLTPASARVILAAFKEMPPFDPFGSAAALAKEHSYTLWLRQECTGEQAGQKFLPKAMGSNLTFPNMFQMFVLNMSDRQLSADLDRLDKYYDTVAALWLKPESNVRVRELATEAYEFQFGLAATMIANRLDGDWRSFNRSCIEVQQVIAALTDYLKEQDDLMSADAFPAAAPAAPAAPATHDPPAK